MNSWRELRKEFYAVLLEALTVNELEQLLFHKCDVTLEKIVARTASRPEVLTAVFQAAQKGQWFEQLASSVIEYRRFNQDVQQVGKAVIAFVTERSSEVYRYIEVDQETGVKLSQKEAEFQKNLQTYLMWLEARYSQLNLRGIEERERTIHELSLNDVYISLKVILDPAYDKVDIERHGRKRAGRKRPQLERRLIDMAELLNGHKQLAITGGPGSGKTTFLHIIANAIARAWNHNDRSEVDKHLKIEGDLPIPIVLSLSEYNRYRRKPNQNRQLRNYITQSLFERELNLSSDFFEQLLAHDYSCLLLLDGLDEVANEEERLLVREAVENLAYTGEIAQMIVTSRTHAYYGETRLGNFRVAQVQPMKPEQIGQLVRRWCNAVYRDLIEIEHEQVMLNAAITTLEMQRLQRGNSPLINSPLMVTIVAIVHYNEHRLPEQRAELYEKCVDVLLTEKTQRSEPTRDELRRRGGKPNEKRQLLGQLAWEMMCAGEDAGREVSERKLRKWLQPRIEMLYGQAETHQRLSEFVSALRERGSLLSEHDKQYRFSHLTFQEYLCAWYLAEEVTEKADIVASLERAGRVGSSWWREVILLLLGYIGMRSATRAFGLMAALLGSGETTEERLVTATTIATAYIELDLVSMPTKHQIQQQLIRLIHERNQKIEPQVRADAGRKLAQIDDSRNGLGIVINDDGIKVPDIVWSDTVQSGIYHIDDNRSDYDNDESQKFLIRQSFRLAKYLITYQQYQCFLDAEDYPHRSWWKELPEDAQKHKEQRFKYPTHPRESITWYQAVAFCRWLGDKLNMNVRLPHEYEWEVAARYVHDGQVNRHNYPWGDDFDATKLNVSDTRLGQTSPVGVFADGATAGLQLYDVGGNVWEWCQNEYDDVAQIGVDQRGNYRALRGGSWSTDSVDCRIAYREYNTPDYSADRLGFRVCVSVG